MYNILYNHCVPETHPYEIVFYVAANGSQPFTEWLDELDPKMQGRLLARINRLKLGLLGDSKAVGDGLFELRCFFGPGYRIYLAISEGRIVILLCGGDKSTQSRDIETARGYWIDWKENSDE